MLNRFDPSYARGRGECSALARTGVSPRGRGDGDIGAVAELRVNFSLLPVGGVEHRGGYGEGEGEGEQHDRSGQHATLPGKSRGTWLREPAGQRGDQPCQRPAAIREGHDGQPPQQQGTTQPEQSRPKEGPVRHREGGDSFGGEYECVVVAT